MKGIFKMWLFYGFAIKLNKSIIKAHKSRFLSLIIDKFEPEVNEAHIVSKYSSNVLFFELYLTAN
jgi:hypothetical protein